MNETLLITGGYGFIGSNFIHMLSRCGYQGHIVNVDKETYAANKANLAGINLDMSNYQIDIADAPAIDGVFAKHKPDLVVNFAAESHVDRSILSSSPFMHSNILGVQVLLDACRSHNVKRFLQISTDEVYGDLPPDALPSREDDKIKPSSPYSASKASADLVVLAYHRTHNMDVVITRCSNNYGPRQFPEKLIPLAIRKIQKGEKIPVYGKGDNIRDWIHVDDHCEGIWHALRLGRAGEIYNFGGNNQICNIDLVRTLLKFAGKGDDGIEFVTNRLGHDFRYDIDFGKATAELAWVPTIPFSTGIKQTWDWYSDAQ